MFSCLEHEKHISKLHWERNFKTFEQVERKKIKHKHATRSRSTSLSNNAANDEAIDDDDDGEEVDDDSESAIALRPSAGANSCNLRWENN